MRHVCVFVLPFLAAVVAAGTPLSAASVDRERFRKQVEADWLLQEEARRRRPTVQISPRADAAGAVDGVKNGRWGFHTAQSRSPWWQVDLGASQPVARVRIWNRCDGVAARAQKITVRLSDDGKTWRTVYTHNGKTFYGATDRRPLVVKLQGQRARFVRLQLPGKTFLHLDEVEVFGPADPKKDLALRRPADQISVSRWSTDNRPPESVNWTKRVREVLAHCGRLIGDLRQAGEDVSAELDMVDRVARKLDAVRSEKAPRALYLEARWVQRPLTLRAAFTSSPPLPRGSAVDAPQPDFDAILFTKRVPGSYNHMSDQYYGWWSQPGGGIYILRGFKHDAPAIECITESFKTAGSFLRPMLSYDGTKVLFAWCRHYPKLAGEKNKLDKSNVPEDAFYHLFEMNLDGTGVRQLTRGKYDDFDARYLPDGRIVFLSTRRGQSIQCGLASARRSVAKEDLPDCYVRCGGGPQRPVAVYTLHTMNADGSNVCAISPFEMFEWTPSVADDGSILYSRWDYVDRWNMPFMSLWAINPDGTNPRIVYGNFTHAPHCTFEPRCIPNSHKIVFTGSAHHAQTMGSLVLLDPSVGTEGTGPITRLTPEVVFPEIEGWPPSYFANPWPLSERFYFVAWGCNTNVREGQRMPPNGMGLYLFDATGGLELIYRDPVISSAWPIPIRPRKRPHVVADRARWGASQEGRFLLVDVTQGLQTVRPGQIKALRIVAVPAKTHPTMNYPNLGLTRDDPGKCVLGTVPVESDGSAHFRVPAGVIVFFQALGDRGMAVQTMRTTTHVQPGQTLSCIGCHERRSQAPPQRQVLAAAREPSRITVGPPGSWPLRFDRLVQPVLDKHCVRCHHPKGEDKQAAKFNLTAAKAYSSLFNYGNPSLRDHVLGRYRQGYSIEAGCVASRSALLAKLTGSKGHHDVKLDPESVERLVTWMDTYAQRLGSFSDEQERELLELRRRHRDLLIERERPRAALGSGSDGASEAHHQR